ncbi:rod shape-determining protein MreC [Deinococcus sp. HMF7620]|uniref:Cell shape-determining protein MreC n=1 Tax=Deinococcus arboris TaxID=2682977 RepID=A0A7C9MRH2_9DEIO|nr:rod shape-determining protein MreC [Deinococcus arboris]MVN87204.1 rod shape-determining protein MreC [Deinococcus arboris]
MKGRAALLTVLGLLGLSMVTTRFQVVAPTALRAGTAPLTRLSVVAADNLRRAVLTVTQERQRAGQMAALQKQNDALRQRNELLTREVSRLRQVVKITTTQAPNALGIAQVVAVDPSPLLARVDVNKGSRDGVRLRMPVTVPRGLVGQVTGVSETRATVLALVDPESSVGVTLQGNRGGRGVARGVPPDRLRAEFSRSVPIKPGDVLVTNSLGGVFPVGIPVGTVEKVLPLGANDINRTVIVKPAVDVGVVEDVTILEGL